MKIEEFITECKEGGLDRAKQLLRKYVLDGQPDSFCPYCTSRVLCREASNAITGENHKSYIDTKYGSELYFYMWGFKS